MTGETFRPDWDAIEMHYRAGIRSLRDIADQFQVSNPAIIKHARKHGWVRNLLGKIQAKADEMVSRAQVSETVSKTALLTEQGRIEVEAEIQSRVRLEHRVDIQKSKTILTKLMDELDAMTKRSAPLKERVAVLKGLVDCQKSLVAMEREAFGIAQMVSAPDDENPADPAEELRRINFWLHTTLSQAGTPNGQAH